MPEAAADLEKALPCFMRQVGSAYVWLTDMWEAVCGCEYSARR